MTEQMGRMAFREEGKNWNVYFARQDTMKDALFLGSIARRFVDNPERKQAFIALMQECFGDVCEELWGTRPVWNEPEPAPESERSGNA